jgi:hypothetical protein
MEDKSYRVVWEIDIDAPDAKTAAAQAYDSVVKGIATVFEIHEWDQPDMITATPVAMIDVKDPAEDLPVPDRRIFNENYMGPTVI